MNFTELHNSPPGKVLYGLINLWVFLLQKIIDGVSGIPCRRLPDMINFEKAHLFPNNEAYELLKSYQIKSLA